MSKKQFIIRFVIYILIGLGLPIGFMAWRFDLFKEKPSTTSVTGWGLVLILIVVVFILKLINGLRKGLKPGSMTKQIVDGIYEVSIPLCLITFIVHLMSGVTEELTQVLIVLTVCETICIPINPIPRWRFENNIEVTENVVKKVIDYIKK